MRRVTLVTSAVLLLAASLVLSQTPPSAADDERARAVREIVALLERAEARRDAADVARAAALVEKVFSANESAEAAYARSRLVVAQSEMVRATGRGADADRELDRAIAYAETAVSRKADWALAHAALADALGRKIDLNGAFAGLRLGRRVNAAVAQAARLAPASADVLLAVGRYSLHAPRLFGGSVDEAVASFRRAVALEPARPLARFWLARALEASGAALDAATEYRKALELEPAYVEARRRLERLEACLPASCAPA